MWLWLTRHECNIRLWFRGKDRFERRAKILELFSESNDGYEIKDATKAAIVIFPVISKGLEDKGSWDEIRKELVDIGTDIYNKIKESDLEFV